MPQEPYDCVSCPGYCCAYPIIPVTRNDIRRLAKHLGMTEERARDGYTIPTEGSRQRELMQTPDGLFAGKSCVFLDKDRRLCTVYEGRPDICRDHPGERCEWHDRRLIEAARRNGKKEVMLEQMPWTIDADHPLYDNDRVTWLLQSYAGNDTSEED